MNKWTLFVAVNVMAGIVFLGMVGMFGVMVENEFVRAHKIEWFLPGQKIEDDRSLDILAFGDMMLGRYVRTLMDKNGKDYIFEKLGRPDDLEDADVVFANLEGPIKGEGFKRQDGMVFGFHEDTAPFLSENGINLVSIANNHAVDQGWDGRATTMAALKDAGVGFCGHPSEADPESVYYGKEDGKSFAFVCLHSVNFPLDMEKAVELVKNVGEEVDYLIVSIHWGIEYSHKANQKMQVEPAHQFVDAGADLVIGHHPHVVQNFEIYEGKFIFYSLGNFVFDQYWSKDTQEELGILVSFGDDVTSVKLIPMKSEKSQSRLMTEDEEKEWTERFIQYGEYGDELISEIKAGIIRVNED